MQERSIVERVEILERKVETLEQLPARMTALELQILQSREEVRADFSATRAELRAEIRAANAALRNELRAEIRAANDALRDELRSEIRGGEEETRRYMRILHEEVLDRLARLDEGRRRPKRH